jgi:methionine-rich copper-binding protein CopC
MKQGCFFRVVVIVMSMSMAQVFSQAAIVSVTPGHNSLNAEFEPMINISFSDSMDTSTLTNNSATTYGSQSGYHSIETISWNSSGDIVTIIPGTIFRAGEIVDVSLNTDILDIHGNPIPNFSWQFTVKVDGGLLSFTNKFSQNIQAIDLCTGDFDNDGFLDLAFPSKGDIEIWVNDRSAFFSYSQTIIVQDNAQAITSGDFDLDGLSDFAVATYNEVSESGNIEIYGSDGPGYYSLQSLSVGGDPRPIGNIDIDSDGDLDLIAGNYGWPYFVSVMLNNRDDGFFPLASLDQMEFLGSGDFNNNGYVDLVCRSYDTGQILICYFDGEGFSSSAITENPLNAYALTCGNFNGDEYLDFAISCWNNDVLIFLNYEGTNFVQTTISDVGSELHLIDNADFDSDDDLDIIVVGYSGQAVVLENDGFGQFSTELVFDLAASYAHCMILADFDNDNDIDLGIGGINTLWVELNIDGLPAPSSPTGLSINVVEGALILSWVQNEEQDLSYYNIYSNTLPDPVTAAIIGTVIFPINNFEDPEGTTDTDLYFWVSAVDLSGNESSLSRSISQKNAHTGLTHTQVLLPESNKLEYNYPNPFNSNTTIPFNVMASSFVSVRIYNTRGRLVQSIVDEHLQPGYYSTSWDASAYNSGIYFCVMSTDSFKEVRKITLLK